MVINEKKSLSEIVDFALYPQTNKNVVVSDKFRIMNNEELLKENLKFNKELEGKGRLMIRASGTEPKIRIMVESRDKAENDRIANAIVSIIKRIDGEN